MPSNEPHLFDKLAADLAASGSARWDITENIGMTFTVVESNGDKLLGFELCTGSYHKARITLTSQVVLTGTDPANWGGAIHHTVCELWGFLEEAIDDLHTVRTMLTPVVPE